MSRHVGCVIRDRVSLGVAVLVGVVLSPIVVVILPLYLFGWSVEVALGWWGKRG